MLTTTAMASSTRRSISAAPSLVALLVGVLAGTYIHYSGSEILLGVRDLLEPLGYLWLRALRMIVFPLVISTLIVAILNSSQFASTGRVGSAAL
jgi:proton glutamate symport protein